MVTRRWSVQTRRVIIACGLCVSLLGACSSGDDSTSPTVPLPTLPPTTGASTTASTSSPPTRRTTPPSTTALNPPPTITNPTTSPTTSVVLPTVTTLVPEVPRELLSPEQADPTSPDNNRPVLPEQLPVLEAHLSAIQANTLASSQWPIDPDAPELIGAPLTPDTLARIQQSLRERLTQHEVLDVSQGVTFRPYVIGPVTDTAVVYDCELAGHYWKNADTGELVTPTEVWPAGPGHIVQVGLRVDMVLRDGRWLVNGSQIDPAACA
jgi:hypothetical protein